MININNFYVIYIIYNNVTTILYYTFTCKKRNTLNKHKLDISIVFIQLCYDQYVTRNCVQF